MSVFTTIGIIISAWAMLSVLGSERPRETITWRRREKAQKALTPENPPAPAQHAPAPQRAAPVPVPPLPQAKPATPAKPAAAAKPAPAAKAQPAKPPAAGAGAKKK